MFRSGWSVQVVIRPNYRSERTVDWKTRSLSSGMFLSWGLGQLYVEAVFDKKGFIYSTNEE